MMPLINQLIHMGYSSAQVLNFIGKKFKNMNTGIDSAKSQGYNEESILKFLSGKIPVRKDAVEKTMSENDKYLSSIGLKTKQEKEDQTNKFIKGAIDIGSTALGAYALYRSIPKIASGLNTAVKGIGQGSNPLSSFPQTSAINKNSIQDTPGLQAAAQISTPSVIQSPSLANKGKETFEKFGLSPKIQDLIKSGNGPEEIEGYIQKFHPKEFKQFEKEAGISLRQALTEFNQQEPIVEEAPEKFKVPESKKLVAFPDGQIGEVESINKGIAKVNIDGTIRNRKMDDLIPEPEDAIEAVQNLLKIPEEDRSSVLAYTAYNPLTQKLYAMYHDGRTVEYDDFDEQDFEDINSGKFTPRTEGKNQFGLWTKEDEKSRGATLYKLLLSNPKYAKNQKDQTWRYLNEGYDYWKGLRKKRKGKK